MSIKPIIFSAPMVRALLAGTKTQTRRLVSNPEYYGCPTGDCPHDKQAECNAAMASFVDEIARFRVGDRAYVRETVRAIERCSGLDQFQYRATLDWEDYDAMTVPSEPEAGDWGDLSVYGRGKAGRKNFATKQDELAFAGPWVPAIHAPRSTSRLWLMVTEIRVQRLQDISGADAVAEGVRAQLPENGIAQQEYADLWNTLHTKPDTRWHDNPWVVAYSFTVHEGNVDAA